MLNKNVLKIVTEPKLLNGSVVCHKWQTFVVCSYASKKRKKGENPLHYTLVLSNSAVRN